VIQSKWSALAPLLSALVLMAILWVIRLSFATDVRPGVATPARTLTVEANAGRLDFTAALEVQVTSIILAMVVGVGLAISALRNRTASEKVVVGTILFFAAVALAVVILDKQSPPEYDDLLAKTVANQLINVKDLSLDFAGMTAIAATILATATAFVLWPTESDRLRRLEAAAESYRRLSYLLTVGTILLVSDIFTKTVLTRWAAAYYVLPADKATIAALGKSIVNGWGVYDSLFLAAAYIPAALIVRTRLRNWGLSEFAAKPIPAWFDPKWLLGNSLEDVGRAAATLIPFIVGQAANLIPKS